MEKQNLEIFVSYTVSKAEMEQDAICAAALAGLKDVSDRFVAALEARDKVWSREALSGANKHNDAHPYWTSPEYRTLVDIGTERQKYNTQCAERREQIIKEKSLAHPLPGDGGQYLRESFEVSTDPHQLIIDLQRLRSRICQIAIDYPGVVVYLGE